MTATFSLYSLAHLFQITQVNQKTAITFHRAVNNVEFC